VDEAANLAIYLIDKKSKRAVVHPGEIGEYYKMRFRLWDLKQSIKYGQKILDDAMRKLEG
jgi:hypothetical protein